MDRLRVCQRRFLPVQGHSGAQGAPCGSSRISAGKTPYTISALAEATLSRPKSQEKTRSTIVAKKRNVLGLRPLADLSLGGRGQFHDARGELVDDRAVALNLEIFHEAVIEIRVKLLGSAEPGSKERIVVLVR